MFEVAACFAAVANADRPSGGLKIKEAERTIWPGVIEADVQLERAFERVFHFFDSVQGFDGLCSGELPEVQAEVITGLGEGRMAVYQLAADCDAFFGDLGSLSVVGGVFGQIETCACELPRCIRICRFGIEPGFCFFV